MIVVSFCLCSEETSAHFSLSGKVELPTQLLNICCKGWEHTSELFLEIFGGIFLNVVALLGLNHLISVSISSNETGLKVNEFIFINWSLIISILGGLEYFCIDFSIGSTMLSVSEILSSY